MASAKHHNIASNQPQKGGKKIKKTIVMRIVMVVAISFTTAAVLLTQQERIYSKKRDVNQLKKEISALEEKSNTYQTELNDSLNLDRVKEVARISGLNFAKADQIHTLDFSQVPANKEAGSVLPENAMLWMPLQTPQITASGESVADAQALTESQEAISRALLEQEEGAQPTQNTDTDNASSPKSTEKPDSSSKTSTNKSSNNEPKSNANSSKADTQTSDEARINEELLANVPELSDDDVTDLE